LNCAIPAHGASAATPAARPAAPALGRSQRERGFFDELGEQQQHGRRGEREVRVVGPREPAAEQKRAEHEQRDLAARPRVARSAQQLGRGREAGRDEHRGHPPGAQ
jgi:hypothetical protein